MAGNKKLPATAAAVAQSYAAPTTKSPANATGDPTQNLQTFKLADLAPFTKEKVFSTNASGDVHLFYVGRDDVHDVLKYILSRVTVSLYLNMFGFDDSELNNILMEKALDPAVTMLVTLDSSQANGVHEKALIEADQKYNLAAYAYAFRGGSVCDAPDQPHEGLRRRRQSRGRGLHQLVEFRRRHICRRGPAGGTGDSRHRTTRSR